MMANRDIRLETQKLNQIPIQTIGTWVGVSLPKYGSTRCPFPDHEDNRPSFEIKKSETKWVCYACNRHGGSIDFVMTYFQLSFTDAKGWLLARTNIPIVHPQPVSAPKKAEPEDQNIKAPLDIKSSHEVYIALHKLSPIQDTGLNYLRGRAISEETISDFKIGQIKNGRQVIRHLIEDFGFDRISQAGLLTKLSAPKNIRCIFPEGSLIFPFIERGLFVYMQARVINGDQSTGKWRNLNYLPRRIYNSDSFKSDSKKIAICEGIMDVLSAIELGISAVGLMGVSANISEDQMMDLRGKEVLLLLDWDAPGDNKAKILQDQLRKSGVVSIRKARPSKNAKDLNEYLMETRGWS